MFGPTLFLVMMISPAPSPPPPVPEVSLRLTTALNAADPDVTPTGKLLPVADLAAASEFAEAQIDRRDLATGQLAALIGLIHDARTLAYARSGDPRHLCRAIVALQGASNSPAMNAVVRQRGAMYLSKTRQQLSSAHPEHACEETSPLLPVRRTQLARKPAAPPRGAAPRVAAVRPEPGDGGGRRTRPPGRGATAAGGVLLGAAAGMLGGLVGVLRWRADIDADVLRLQSRIAASEGGRRTAAHEAERLQLGHDVRTSTALVAGLTAGAVVATATGVALVVVGTLKRARARVTPYGGLSGGGLVLRVNF